MNVLKNKTVIIDLPLIIDKPFSFTLCYYALTLPIKCKTISSYMENS